MKKIISLITAIMLCVALAAPAFAESGSWGGVSYTLENGVLTITGSGEIPSKAFYLRSDITSVSIPGTVTKINKEAFMGCSRITSLYIADGVTEIGEGAFSACSGITELELPHSITVIKEAAFYNCLDMTATVRRTGNTRIADNAFHGINSLIVKVPSGWNSDFNDFDANSVEYITNPSVDLSNGYYIIHSALSWEYCLDIDGGANAQKDGDNLHLWPCNSAAAKIFYLEKDENKNAYIIRAVHSGKILDVFGTESAPGMTVMQWGDLGEDDQRWVFEDADGNGSFYIRTLQNGYMDVANGAVGENVNVYCAAFSGETRQMWMLEGTVYEELVNGSTLSEGSVWIICAVAAAAVIAVGAIVIVKKKKPAK